MKYLKPSFLFIGSVFFTLAVHASGACPEFPYFQPKNGPLALVNCDFHVQYEKRVIQIMNSFGAPGGRPVILNLGGALLLKYNGRTENVNITPSTYHNLKSFAHAAFAIFLVLSSTPPGPLSTATQNTLREIQKNLQLAAKTLTKLEFSTQERDNTKKLADLTNAYLAQLLLRPYYTRRDLDTYYKNARPLMLKSGKMAAEIELALLNKAVNRWLSQMTPQEKNRIGIVVATSHQARAQEISLQYFARKFKLKFGEGAVNENGFVVMEDKFDEASALKLLARHFLDREAAKIIFNDPGRLQRDLLADGGKAVLNSANFK